MDLAEAEGIFSILQSPVLAAGGSLLREPELGEANVTSPVYKKWIIASKLQKVSQKWNQ